MGLHADANVLRLVFATSIKALCHIISETQKCCFLGFFGLLIISIYIPTSVKLDSPLSDAGGFRGDPERSTKHTYLAIESQINSYE